eukprot:446600-Rhodomonas_salina.1
MSAPCSFKHSGVVRALKTYTQENKIMLFLFCNVLRFPDDDHEEEIRRLTEELLPAENVDETAAGENFGENDPSSPEAGGEQGVGDRPEGDTAVVAEEGPREEAGPPHEPEVTVLAEPPTDAPQAQASVEEPPKEGGSGDG